MPDTIIALPVIDVSEDERYVIKQVDNGDGTYQAIPVGEATGNERLVNKVLDVANIDTSSTEQYVSSKVLADYLSNNVSKSDSIITVEYLSYATISNNYVDVAVGQIFFLKNSTNASISLPGNSIKTSDGTIANILFNAIFGGGSTLDNNSLTINANGSILCCKLANAQVGLIGYQKMPTIDSNTMLWSRKTLYVKLFSYNNSIGASSLSDLNWVKVTCSIQSDQANIIPFPGHIFQNDAIVSSTIDCTVDKFVRFWKTNYGEKLVHSYGSIIDNSFIDSEDIWIDIKYSMQATPSLTNIERVRCKLLAWNNGGFLQFGLYAQIYNQTDNTFYWHNLAELDQTIGSLTFYDNTQDTNTIFGIVGN